MKRIWSLLLCAAMMLAVFAGCGQDSEEPYVPTGNALVMDDGSTISTTPQNEDEDPDRSMNLTYYPDRSLNPLTCTDLTNRTLFSLLYQGLFTVDKDYQVEPLLCKSYTASEDMKTYTFYLEDAAFSDGTRLTADDVSASLNAAMNGKYYGGRFHYINRITATEEGTVVVSLSTAMENLPLLLDIPIVKASEVDAEQPLGTGPYVMEVALGGQQLRRLAGWWCNADLPVNAEVISLMEAESDTQIRDAFEFESLDLVCVDPGSDTYADYRCDYELWDCESGTFVYLGCNMDSAVFSDNTVRAALTHAIDRNRLAEEYYRGFGRSATLPASPTSPYYDAGLASKYGYEPTKFLQALESAGKQGASIVLLVNSDDSLRLRAARAIGQMLTDCGLMVEMKEVNTKAYKECLSYRTYDLYVGETRLSANMDLTHFFYSRGGMSYGKIEDGTLYAMCQQALANSGNYYSLHRAVMDDGRLCPVLFYNYAVYVTRGLLTDLEPSRDNVFYYSLGKTMEDALIVEETVPDTTAG